MVAKSSSPGLIATTRAEAPPPLEELVDCCGWPLLLQANPRRLQRELSLHNPDCVLFWTDDWYGIAPTAQLIAWSRQRGARPYRVAVAYQLQADVEAVFRAAGAHSFLPIAGRSGAAVADALWQLVDDAIRPVGAARAGSTPWAATGEHAAPIEVPSNLVRPP